MTAAVIDASVLVDAIAGGADDQRFAAAIESIEKYETLIGPWHLYAETVSAFRAMERRGQLGADEGLAMLEELAEYPIDIHPTTAKDVEFCWSVRESVWIKDGIYVALARRLDVPLLTVDQRLAKTASSHCRIDSP